MSKPLMILIFGLLCLGSTAQEAFADVGKWEAGKHYLLIDPPQPTGSGDKIEVLEVFSYGCPHCAEFQPTVDKIKTTLPAYAVLDYIPAEFQPAWSVFARAFYTAQALGILEKTHKPLFNAIYVDHKVDPKPNRIEDITSFYTSFGVKAEDFVAMSQSFAIETRLKRARALIKAYAVEGTPSIIVNGKYRITGASAGSYDNMIVIVQYLIAQENALNKVAK